MKVRVTSCDREVVWYSVYIGTTFEVVDSMSTDGYALINEFQDKRYGKHKGCISRHHCVIVGIAPIKMVKKHKLVKVCLRPF